jgi:hypothetical protein
MEAAIKVYHATAGKTFQRLPSPLGERAADVLAATGEELYSDSGKEG